MVISIVFIRRKSPKCGTHHSKWMSGIVGSCDVIFLQVINILYKYCRGLDKRIFDDK